MKVLSDEEIKARLVEILQFFIKVCEEHKIRYFVAGGTCLGAIRHNGFIPWDDDIDVYVPRNDYEKLIHIFAKYKDAEFQLKTFNDKDYYLPFYKLVDKNTILYEKDVKKKV